MKKALAIIIYLGLVPRLEASDISLTSLKRLAETCLRMAAHREANFVYIDPTTAVPTRLRVGVRELGQIAQTGQVQTPNGQSIDATRRSLIDPLDTRRIERAAEGETTRHILQSLEPVRENLDSLSERFAPTSSPSGQDLEIAIVLLKDLRNNLPLASQEEGPLWSNKPAGYLIEQLSIYSPRDFIQIQREIEGMMNLIEEYVLDAGRRELDPLRRQLLDQISIELNRLQHFLTNLRNAYEVRIQR